MDTLLIEKLSDPLWRLSNLYWIEDKQGKVVKFKPNFFQALLLKDLHPRNIILKARQLGMSTFIAMLFLDQILFHKNKKAAIVADKLESGKNIFGKIAFAWENFDPRLKEYLNLQLNTDQGSFFEFSNESSIRVGTTIHSGTYQYLHISELGPLCKESPEKADTVIKSAFPTVADAEDTLVFIESTAEGENNDFHLRCVEAMRELEEAKVRNKPLFPFTYRFFFFPWWQNEEYEYTEDVAKSVLISRERITYFNELESRLGITLSAGKRAWYEIKARDIKERMREQYPSFPEEAFLASGDKLFDADILNEKLKTDPIEPLMMTGDLLVFKMFKRGHRYAVGADVGTGVGRDASAAVVVDFTSNEIVATYKNNSIDPIQFGQELAKIGVLYGGCLIAPESNSVGIATCITLNNMYPNVYNYEIKGYTETKETMRLGWLTNSTTKSRMFYELKEAIQAEVSPLTVLDKSVLHEAIAYSKTDIRLTEKEMQKLTRHFDLLTAAAIAWQMRDHAQVVQVGDDRKTLRMIESRRERVRVFG